MLPNVISGELLAAQVIPSTPANLSLGSIIELRHAIAPELASRGDQDAKLLRRRNIGTAEASRAS